MDDILSKYNTSTQGLTTTEIEKRQEIYGLNEIEHEKPTPAIILFLSQFIDILIALLIIAAIASLLIGDVIDAGVIMLAVLLNTILGFIQEYRSQRAVESLKDLMVKKAIVKRDSTIKEVDAKTISDEEALDIIAIIVYNSIRYYAMQNTNFKECYDDT